MTEEVANGLQRLWSPWRSVYVQNPDRHRSGDCLFCELPARGSERDAESYILYRGTYTYVLLNAFPYNPGHLMVVPYRHVGGFDELVPAELHEMADLCQQAVRVLKAVSGSPAFNIGVNAGALAGAGIGDHIHQHVVPRWDGDTNYMPIIAQTRVLPELLEETYARLAPAFARAGGPGNEPSQPPSVNQGPGGEQPPVN